MKKIIYKLSVIILTLSVLSSCTKYLEIEPTDRQTPENFYKTRDDVFNALMGIYKPITYQGWGNWHDLGISLDVMSDDIYKGGGTRADAIGWAEMSEFNSQSQTAPVGDLWSKDYKAISRANILLSKYDQIEFKDKDAEDKANFKAEALFLRGHFHLEAVRLFENIPLLITPVTASDWKDVRQASPEEVYAQIAKDMLDAIPNLAEQHNAANLGRITKWAAQAELARAFLFYTGYYGKSTMPIAGGGELTKTQVLDMLKDIINNGGFSLLSDFADNFIASKGNYSSEAVFEIPYADTGNMDWNDSKTGNVRPVMNAPAFYDGNKLGAGWALCVPTHDLHESFEVGDLRRNKTIITAEELISDGSALGARYQHTSLFSYKYTLHKENYPTGGGYDILNDPTNYHLIRYADVLLMAAELDMGAQGLEWLNEVRNRAGLAPKTEIDIDVVYRERRSELAMEGIRYWDILRRGLDYAEDNLTIQNYFMRPPSVPGVSVTGDVGSTGDFERVFDRTKRGFLPIPQYELDLNSGLKQNVGY